MEIERLRGVAVLATVVTHYGPVINDASPNIVHGPWSGVDLFFVISGFVVTMSLLRTLPETGEDVPVAIGVLWCLPSAVPAYMMERPGSISLWLISALLVGYAALNRGYALGMPVVRTIFEYIGSRSYALCLVHHDIRLLDEALRPKLGAYSRVISHGYAGAWLHFAILLAAGLAVSEILYRVVEKPFIAAGRAVIDEGPSAIPRWPRAAVAALGVSLVVFPFRHLLVRLLTPKNLAYEKAVAMSSRAPGGNTPDMSVNGRLDEDRCAMTQTRTIRGSRSTSVRPPKSRPSSSTTGPDAAFDDALPLALSVSSDHSHYDTLYTRQDTFTQGLPWIHRARGGVEARHVRFSVHRKTTLCLSEVEIYG